MPSGLKLLWFLAFICGGWFWYFIKSTPSTFSLLLLLAMSAAWAVVFWRDVKKVAAANNVIVGGVTFKSLPASLQKEVHERAMQIIRRAGWTGTREPSFSSSVQQFGWYALAMRELGIKPIGMIPRWSVVRNPFTALGPKDAMVLLSATAVARDAGVLEHLD